PLDPQPPEVTLAVLAVVVGVDARVQDLLLGLAVQPGTLTAVAAGLLEGGATLLLRIDCALHSCHVSVLLSDRPIGAWRSWCRWRSAPGHGAGGACGATTSARTCAGCWPARA